MKPLKVTDSHQKQPPKQEKKKGGHGRGRGRREGKATPPFIHLSGPWHQPSNLPPAHYALGSGGSSVSPTPPFHLTCQKKRP
ncbi:hypothetical protein VTH06DRAFT_4895 [Thermothelomyces fergusii]